MTFEFTEDGLLIIDMDDYVKRMIEEFPMELGDSKTKNPAHQDLFEVDEVSPLLDSSRREQQTL